jgi:argininosuccinate lyase
MKLWQKKFNTHQKIEAFTVGDDRELDLHLAKYDVIASMAHAKMLGNVGLITLDEVKLLVSELEKIGKSIDQGTFIIETDFEDVHSKIEFLLTRELGDTGKKIHAARSRNDQVLVAIQLYLKNEIAEIKELVKDLFEVLINLAEKHKNTLLPGYTHLQIAMPSSFGLWFSGYAESLIDDVILLQAATKIVDQNPLGSAAGYGSSFPIDRAFTTQELGFETMKFNVIAAQMSRGKSEKITAFALSSVAATLAKFSMDICLYMSQNFDFISFPNELTTGSSIMPHKKNPDVFELIRGKCNKIQAVPNQLALLTTNLPGGYHREMQLTKEIIIPAIQDLKASLDMMIFSIQNILVKEHILEDKKYDYLYSVETLNQKVLSGIPFREAYKQIGEAIENGTFEPHRTIKHTHAGSIGNLCLDEIRKKMKQAME